MSFSARAFEILLLIASATGLSACAPAEITQRYMLGITAGGIGESWLVVEETAGRTDRTYMDTNRYVVYRCVPTGCAAISVLRGSERHELAAGSSSPTTIPTAK